MFVNRTVAAAAGIALFSAGVLTGLLLRRGPATDPARAPAEALRPASAAAPSTERDRSAGEEPQKLQRRIQELEAELLTIRERPPKAEAPPRTAEFATALFKEYVDLRRSTIPDPEKARTLFARLDQLDERYAAVFIELYRKSIDPELDEERDIAVELALASGGPAAADFVNVLLNDSSLELLSRRNLLDELSGVGGGLFSIRRLPVNEALADTAMNLCRSTTPEDRQGGAGLLGGVRTEKARAELRRMVEQDPDLRARAAAALSLGQVGDASTRTFLERVWATKTAEQTGVNGSRFRSALETAIKSLADR